LKGKTLRPIKQKGGDRMIVYEGQRVGYPTLELLELDATDLLFDDFDMQFIHVEEQEEQ